MYDILFDEIEQGSFDDHLGAFDDAVSTIRRMTARLLDVGDKVVVNSLWPQKYLIGMVGGVVGRLDRFREILD